MENERMKIFIRGLLFSFITFTLFFSSPALAFLNNFDTGSVQELKTFSGTLGVSGASDFYTLFGRARYGIGPAFEVNGKLGVLHSDLRNSATGIIVGIGGKYKAAFLSSSSPDIALTGSYNLGVADGRALHSLTGGFLISKPFTWEKSSFSITPYGGGDLEILGGSLNDDTDINLHLILGAEIPLQKQIALTGELKIGGNASIGIGATYRF